MITDTEDIEDLFLDMMDNGFSVYARKGFIHKAYPPDHVFHDEGAWEEAHIQWKNPLKAPHEKIPPGYNYKKIPTFYAQDGTITDFFYDSLNVFISGHIDNIKGDELLFFICKRNAMLEYDFNKDKSLFYDTITAIRSNDIIRRVYIMSGYYLREFSCYPLLDGKYEITLKFTQKFK
jgi:hypothetical protein